MAEIIIIGFIALIIVAETNMLLYSKKVVDRIVRKDT